MARRRRCVRCGTHTMDLRCANCGSTDLRVVPMNAADERLRRASVDDDAARGFARDGHRPGPRAA